MYNDLTAVITKHLLSVSDKLKEVNDPLLHVQQFSYHLNQYKQALKAIVSLFHHLNRYYVTTVLHKDLSRELTKLFNQHISDNSQLFAALNALGKRSFAIGPENLSDIIQQLYALNPDYAKRAPEVFARFIPNVFGSTDESDIPALIQWTKELQEQFPLRGVYPSANSHKRKMDSD
ncbi:uncharacterized protein TRIADDRAFT_58586 [Trichoplax adhaerens]|uniref:Uncharacterized protein n=1 Tax=Trichoplax adhaerens TaxID=10228 RepID=B3S342_TRIAD|nr:hypothetical protein TRIADDRAFT_58586 [Trichoplax adhaerens]EDV22725.1 hypothetical protein TRIADDRAFT_58586 [Trichoplax adhaerens]|eukprot:XP_002114591.1 hypothetical protein TRIADDRAFT_58586 [Trichoplax adhaerens]